jgi:hypothetical protein
VPDRRFRFVNVAVIAAVPGARFVLDPGSRVLTLVVVFPVRLPAWMLLGLRFLYPVVGANLGFFAGLARLVGVGAVP